MTETEEGGAGNRTTVLVVDDDAMYAHVLTTALRDRFPDIAVETASSMEAAAARIERGAVDALVLDVSLPDGEGLGVVERARRLGAEIPFLFLSADCSARTAVRALHAGALDYLVKDGSAVDRTAAVLRALVEARGRQDESASVLLGASAAMRGVRAAIVRCGHSAAPVRIEGETGVGKELVARSIHAASDRARGPFVAVNCGALPDALAEAEFFGHVRGAYTGANENRTGLVEHAAGGTLMLDEVEDLPAAIQGKLLRLLQEREYRPVGTARVRRADVRILAASNRDLEAMVRSGAFRSDLFYRLDVLRVCVPPLRDRPTDLPALIGHLLARAELGDSSCPAVAPLAHELAAMRHYAWPGNVRELENFVERARAVAAVAGWRAGWASALAELHGRSSMADDLLPAAVAESSGEDGARDALERLLARHRWRRETVARELGISRVTLWRRMRRHGLIGDR